LAENSALAWGNSAVNMHKYSFINNNVIVSLRQ